MLHKLPNVVRTGASPKHPAPSFFCTWILSAEARVLGQ